ncbi:MAG: hypothetical protein ACTHN0_15375 [Aquihabitans sp.]
MTMKTTRTTRTLATIALALTLALTACGGGGGSDARGVTPGAGGLPSAGASTTGSPPAEDLDACALLDAHTIADVTGLAVADGTAGAAIGSDSRCEFTSADGGTDVAVQVGRKGGASPSAESPLLTKDGFEETFGGREPVAGLAHAGFGFLDDSLSVAQAAVVSTDGEEYALVTLTGFDLSDADIDTAAHLVAAVEAAR